jgi:hypothetical protein
MSATLLETEKSYNLQTNGFFTMVFSELSFKINKIELAKLIKQCGHDVVKINASQPFFKKKNRNRGGGKKASQALVKRPRKFMIKLKTGQILSQENMDTINTKLGLK